MCNVRSHVLIAILVAVSVGCGATRDQLVRRASYDMSCPETQIQVYEIDNRTRGVQGCGQRATYIESCTDPARASNTCTWVLNSDANRGPQQQASAPPAPPPPAPTPTVEPALHAGLDGHAQMILQCTNGQGVDVVAAYAADGTVTFSLLGVLAGTPAEACVRTGLGPVRMDSGGRSGAITHAIAGAAVAPAPEPDPWGPPAASP